MAGNEVKTLIRAMLVRVDDQPSLVEQSLRESYTLPMTAQLQMIPVTLIRHTPILSEVLSMTGT